MFRLLLWLGLVGGASAATLEDLSIGPAPEKLVYKTIGDINLSVDVYAPPGESEKPRSAILIIHGGGWTSPGPFRFVQHCRYFASRGMVAVNVEYRLVSKASSLRIADCVADCRDALVFVHQSAGKLGIDPERIVVAGESSGGHLAAALALLPGATLKPAALVLYNPVVDLVATKWLAGHPGVAALPGSPVDETWKERAVRVSPLQYVQAGLPPTLLMHGVDDTVVPVEQADRFAALMQAAGNQVEYQRMAGWGHAFLIPKYGKDEQIVEGLRLTDLFLAGLGFLSGPPTITMKK